MKAEVKIPTMGESVTEGLLAAWLKSEGDYVEKDEDLFEIESDKATLSVPATEAGVLHILVEEGTTVTPEQVVAELDTDAKAPATNETASNQGVEKTAPEPAADSKQDGSESRQNESTSGEKEHLPSPAAQRILNEKGISADHVSGSGKDGRITKGDALKAENSSEKSEKKETSQSKSPEKTSTAKDPSRIRRTPMSPMRKAIARNLLEVKQSTAMLTTFNEVDMSQVMAIREKYANEFKELYQAKPGMTSFFAMAASRALMEYPELNASIDGDDLIYREDVDLGISVSTEKGLVVPVIRGSQNLGLKEMDGEIRRLAKAARDRKLAIDDLQGGSFSITNGGVFGSLMSTPILNVNQSGILGLHNIVERPVAVEGKVEIRPMMYVALSYDHRIVDGSSSVLFLKRICQLIADPVRLLLQV